MAFKLRSPINYNPITGSSSNPTLIGSLINHMGSKSYSSKGITSSSADANDRVNKRGKYAEKASSSKGSGVIPNTSIDPNANKRPDYERPGTGSTKVNKTDNTTKSKNTIKPKSSTSTKSKPAAKPISSSDSGDRSGGYLKDTKNFSLGVDTSMGGNISKVQNVVSKARDAGHNLISGGAMSKRDRIRNRQGVRTENKRTRVGQQIERIKGRQQRAGISKDKGTNTGYSTEQKKLDTFEKSMGSSKAAKPSMKLKPTMSKTQTLTDSQLNKKLNKPAVKKKTTGKTKSLSMTRGEKQKSLTDLAMTGKK